MGRRLACVAGMVFGAALFAAPAKAQVHVDVGVYSGPVSARVVVGRPNVYVVDRYYEPVVVHREVYRPVYYPPAYLPPLYREVHYAPAYYARDYYPRTHVVREYRTVRHLPPGQAKKYYGGGKRGRR
jgi:hypothetical protein